MGNAPRLDVHVVTHTHWDREWYHPVGRFRQRLVALIDELLAERADTNRSFLLDGQAIVLDDYLAVRPDRGAELGERLRSGAIEAGPWYVLADELIPGGEALVRNLLAGRRSLAALRAAPPPVLYCPDSFGHPAALPLIAAGFDFPLIILWRGLGGAGHPRADTVRWRSPDRSEVTVYHLARSGYELGSSLPSAPQAALERWTRMREQLADRSLTGVVLLPNGADHHALQERHEEALAALARVASPDRVTRTSLAAFVKAATDAARGADLPIIEGELRDSYGYTWSLQGTLAARAAQKRQAAIAERLLTRDAEPWAAIARCRGGVDRRQLVNAAWQSLLQCHPHDTLCGCSTDEVARAMNARLEDAIAQAVGIRDDALLDVIGHDPVAAREQGSASWRPVLVVRNSVARPRGGVVELDIDTFVKDVPVGPGSGAAVGMSPDGGAGAISRNKGQALVADDATPSPLVPASGVAFQTLGRKRIHSRTESPRHYPDNDLVERASVVAWLDAVPAYGTRAIPLVAGRGRPAWPAMAVTGKGRCLDNGLIRVEADASSVIVSAAGTPGRVTARFIGLEDAAERGDLYTHSSGDDIRQAALLRVRLLARGPLRAELETVWRIGIVSWNGPSAAGNPKRRRKGSPAVNADITATFTLDAGAEFARVRVRGDNPAGDHRLRVIFASGIVDPAVVADAAFGPIVRHPIVATEAGRQMEIPPPTAPLHRYVSLYGESAGLTIVSDGLAEYEASPEGGVAVTLLRAVGELSRNDLPERPGHAGWPVPTPGAQSIGPFVANFAMMPHGPQSLGVTDAVERAVDDALVPLVGATLRSAHRLPAPTHGVELQGSGLAFSALKDSEDGRWLVLRCINLTDAERRGRWQFGFPVTEARLARLDETPLANIEFDETGLPFGAPARAVVTILVR